MKLMILLSAALAVGADERIKVLNRQKRQSDSPATTMSPTALDETTISSTILPSSSPAPTNGMLDPSTSSESTTLTTPVPSTITISTTTPSSTSTNPNNETSSSTSSEPTTATTPSPNTASLTTIQPNTTTPPSAATVNPATAPPYLPPTDQPNNGPGYAYPVPAIPFNYPSYGRGHQIPGPSSWPNRNLNLRRHYKIPLAPLESSFDWQPNSQWMEWHRKNRQYISQHNGPRSNPPNNNPYNQRRNSFRPYSQETRFNNQWIPNFGPHGQNGRANTKWANWYNSK